MKKIILFLCLTSVFKMEAQWVQVAAFGTLNIGATVDMGFLNDSTGVVSFSKFISPSSGSTLSIERTNNFGSSWSGVFSISGMGIAGGNMQMLKGDSAYYYYTSYGNPAFKKTINSGQSWSTPSATLTNLSYTGFNFLQSNYGYFVDSYLNFKRYWNDKVTPKNTFSVGVSCVWAKSYSSVLVVNSGTVICVSNDTGATWSPVYTSGTTLNDIYFPSGSVGYICGNNGAILKTINGGASWTSLTVGFTDKLNSVHFRNDTVGYCVGDNGCILKTSNGGANWYKQPVSTTNNLIRVMALKNKAYTLDSGGNLFRIDIDTCTVYPSVSISVSSNTTCTGVNSNSVSLVGSPPGGSFVGSNIIGSTFYSASLSPGTYGVGYYYAGSGGCGNLATKTITVNPLPPVFLSTVGDWTTCAGNSSTIALNGSPAGGIYSGPQVTGNMFVTPTTAGYFYPSYTYTDPATGCYKSSSTFINVILCTGIAETSQNDSRLVFSPNPFSGKLNITNTIEMPLNMEIYNSSGMLVYKTDLPVGHSELRLDDLSDGFYFIKAQSGRDLIARKILKTN